MEIVKNVKKADKMAEKMGVKITAFQPHFNRKNYIVVFSRTIFVGKKFVPTYEIRTGKFSPAKTPTPEKRQISKSLYYGNP